MVISRKTCRSDKNNIGKLIASIILEKYFKKKVEPSCLYLSNPNLLAKKV